MLVPVDLMSIVSNGSPLASARDAGNSNVGAAPSWRLTADVNAASKNGNDMINKIFLSYAADGEANPAARFAADLKALLTAHGVAFSAGQAGLPQVVGLTAGQQSGETGELAWSVDELLQMSTGPTSGGNSLPLNDQSLPSVLGNWLAALTAPAAEGAINAETMPASVSNANALLLGGNGSPGEAAAGLASTTSAVADATGLISGLTNATAAGSHLGVANLGAEPQTDTDALLAAAIIAGASAAGVAGTGEETLLRSPAPADVARQAAEIAQVNPGSQKVASDAANASAFRSIQFSQPGSGDTAGSADGPSASQPELTRASVPLERNQAIASQLSSAVVASTPTDSSTPVSTSQLFNPADGSAIMNRAEQRMFATESAQQAQSQATQQTATRTAEGLPRFAMDTAFGQQGWSDSLGRQLLVMSSQGISSAQIRLDPPELGSLTVKIQMSADQQTNVSFVSQHALVREALEQQLNRLQDLFRDQGLNLQDVSVSDQSPQQREGEGGGQQGEGRAAGTGEQEPNPAEPVMVRSESLIDFYA